MNTGAKINKHAEYEKKFYYLKKMAYMQMYNLYDHSYIDFKK